MTRRKSRLSNLQQPARQAASHPWMEQLARFGFAAKGIVYFVVGLIVIGVGISYFYQAYKAGFQRHFNQHQMSATERNWAKWMGQFGIAARGTVFCIIGIFLILAALHANAGEARGLDGALAALAQQPFGPWLLGIVALGFIAYSIYSLIEARYRRITQPQ